MYLYVSMSNDLGIKYKVFDEISLYLAKDMINTLYNGKTANTSSTAIIAPDMAVNNLSLALFPIPYVCIIT